MTDVSTMREKKGDSPPGTPTKQKSIINLTNNNNISALNEDENFIKNPPSDGLKKYPSISDFDKTETFKPTGFRLKVASMMESRAVDITILILIIIYTLLVFISISLDNGCNSDDDTETILLNLKYLEIAIISTFFIEIFFKIIGFGFKTYFSDYWMILDCVIIMATFALVIVDIVSSDSNISSLTRVRGIFRLFRIFLLMRKANQFSRMTRKNNLKSIGVDVKAPAEKIIDLLNDIKRVVKSKDLKSEIEWAVEMISTNKLYDPIAMEEGNQQGQSEVNTWLKSYTQTAAEARRDSKASNREGARRMSILNARRESLKSPTHKPAGILIPSEISVYLEKEVNDLEFDVVKLKDMSLGEELSIITYHLFDRQNFFDLLNIDISTFVNFIRKIQSGYLPNPYHNSTHAADVVQTANYLITKGNLIDRADLTNLEIACIYIAAAVHDYEHPGTNNVYHINTKALYALRYNDRAVLENHHVSASFMLTREENMNIFKNFTTEDFKLAREKIISMVLATDMANHFADVAKLRGRLAADFNPKEADRNFSMNLVIHAADISNPIKPWDTCSHWAYKIVDEFWNQGDQERKLGLPISQLCDRYTTNTAKSQMGFIDFVVSPLFVLMKEVLPGIDISHLEKNKEKWKEKVEHYDKLLAELNAKKEP